MTTLSEGDHPLKIPTSSVPRCRIAVAAFLLLAALAGLCACRENRVAPALPPGAKAYEMKGRIVDFAPGRTAVTIEHEDVPGFMPAMVMPFYVKDQAVVASRNPGDAVSFRFVVAQKDSWIDQMETIEASSLHLVKRAPPAPAAGARRLREGDMMPEFKLVDQDGRPITRENFAGEPVILTFIFTRCPVPNFCPLMTSNFEELQKRISPLTAPKAKLLSISFDSDFDHAPVLKAYAEAHGADPAVWNVAGGDHEEIAKLTGAFSVHTQKEGGTISHGLCTVLVNRTGTIVAIWRGNGWSPAEVFDRLATLDRPAR